MDKFIDYIDALENRHQAYKKVIGFLIDEIVDLKVTVEELEKRIESLELNEPTM